MSSFRAQLVTRRSYNRPLNDEGTVFETWSQTIDRVMFHQRWLWERALGRHLDLVEMSELEQLRELMLDRKVCLAGRTLWLGGTETSKRRESSNFNCSFGRIEDVYDVVDAYWLLLQGCGVGFEPITGILNGFTKRIPEIEIRRSKKVKGDPKGNEKTVERFAKGIWHLRVGDSAEAWAKLPGKLLAQKKEAKKLILDFEEIRAAGMRLRGYGWLSSGDETISRAMVGIIDILNHRAGQLLSRIDILDIMNWLGTTLSSRRAAEGAVMPFLDPEAEAFATAKAELSDKWWRSQSNNTLLFFHQPSKLELRGIFHQMIESGGSEPGFANAVEALRRAPWFKGFNPCFEILLGNKSFCNLCETDLAKFGDDIETLLKAVAIVARANYRQTCVNLKDGVLSDSWHELNEFLRLTGVGLTGIVRWIDTTPTQDHASVLRNVSEEVRAAVHAMADELGLPRSKAVTTVKPSGTQAKCMDTTEGAHRPLGRYVFNTVQFSAHDPVVPLLESANYDVRPHPHDPEHSVLVVLPVEFDGVKFSEVDGLEVNTESAIEQLERYKMLMENYVDHNCSITVSYDPSEVPEIVDWLDKNWDSFVAVSWLFRDDPFKTAEDLGYAYLPQKVVTKEQYEAYVSKLLPVDIDAGNSHEEIVLDDCTSGTCPIR